MVIAHTWTGARREGGEFSAFSLYCRRYLLIGLQEFQRSAAGVLKCTVYQQHSSNTVFRHFQGDEAFHSGEFIDKEGSEPQGDDGNEQKQRPKL